jgi:cytochrome c oxidase subunit 4
MDFSVSVYLPGESRLMNAQSIKALSWTWAGLLVLLGLSCGSAYIALGALNAWINIAIAVVKALLVAFVFMHLSRSSGLVRLVACAGFVWLLILTALAGADFLTRT